MRVGIIAEGRKKSIERKGKAPYPSGNLVPFREVKSRPAEPFARFDS